VLCRATGEDPESEKGQNGKHVVHDIRLDRFEGNPLFFQTEAVDLAGKSEAVRLKIVDHDHHLRIDSGVLTDVLRQVCPEGAEIGEASPVDRRGFVHGILHVIHGDIPFTRQHVAMDQLDRLEFLFQLLVEKPDAGHVDADRELDAPSFGLLHAPPVLEPLRDECVGWQADDALVVILH